MAAGTVTGDVDERLLPREADDDAAKTGDSYIVILYNDDVHSAEQVVAQLQKATGYDLERCIRIMYAAHTSGRAIAYSGSEEECERCARILRQIRLQVETDRA